MVKLFYPKDAAIALLEQFDHFLPYHSLFFAVIQRFSGEERRLEKPRKIL
jgi:hypothetical protein